MSLLLISILGGAITLGSYKLFFEDHQYQSPEKVTTKVASYQKNKPHTTFVSHTSSPNSASFSNPDFTKAAAKTVHAVVHVKNVEVRNQPRNMSEYLRGIRGGKFVRGMGSGVIITPDGFIVTNNHVIEGASELDVTLNNNRTYKAKVIGAVPQEDIALIKIDAENLDYLPFGDSNSLKVGQWVLAVGNPFNLTSTVTAGIVSAKGRNLKEGGRKLQSYIQTDAAINPGNSGGALVNINGELIGINSAITSRTGSYIGYSFAIPSNNARKIVEDLMEYGDVKNAILGITGNTIDPKKAKEFNFSVSQGVHVVSSKFGSKKAGLEKGDLITKIDGIRVRKMSDLTSYIATKRPGDKVQINYLRKGKERITKVKLTEYETYVIEAVNLEVANAGKDYLTKFRADHGVRITQSLSRDFPIPQDQFIIVGVDGQVVNSVKEVKKIIEKKGSYSRTKITFQNRKGQQETITF